ncbi:MAG: Trm112 family protein [Methanomicrobiales archaeon]|nr:Trm112 family protein [Methanomicrobiales archaeon]
MKRSTLAILCCPVCKGDLELRIERSETQESAEEEIIEGGLYCRKCEIEYPISDGIPDLLPKGGESC